MVEFRQTQKTLKIAKTVTKSLCISLRPSGMVQFRNAMPYEPS
jgi:hypothetical protein